MTVTTWREIDANDKFDQQWAHWSRVYEYSAVLERVRALRPRTLHNTACGWNDQHDNRHLAFIKALSDIVPAAVHSDIDPHTIGGIERYDIREPHGQQYDCVLCISVLEHLPSHEDRLKALDCLLAQVAPGGTLIITLDVSQKWKTAALVKHMSDLTGRFPDAAHYPISSEQHGVSAVMQWESFAGTLGVVVGCDSVQEWMLPWWWENYRKYNHYPMLFCDWGMSDAAYQWCLERGEVCPLEKRNFTQAWHYKSLAMQRSRFDRSIWLDIDCEVRGSLQPVFDTLAHSEVALADDPYCPFSCDNYAGTKKGDGIVGFRRGAALITEWADQTEKLGHTVEASQTLLHNVLSRHEFAQLPRRFHWLRKYNDPGNADAVVMHWTGKVGKKHIREMLSHG